MRKITKITLILLVIISVFCIVCSAQTAMFDFKTDSLGWTIMNSPNKSFDGENIVAPSDGTNSPFLRGDFGVGELKVSDYKYFVLRIKAVSDSAPYIKPYFQFNDASGNATNSIWQNGGLSSQAMQVGEYNTYLFDMTTLTGFAGSYLEYFVLDIGFGDKTMTAYIDYAAFCTGDEICSISFDKNADTVALFMPSAVNVVKGQTLDLSEIAKPVRRGYDFAGWTNNTQTGSVINEITVNENITLYALWTANNGKSIKFDYTTDKLGWNVSNSQHVHLDTENLVLTASASNPTINRTFGTTDFKISDYKYLVVRAKAVSSSGSATIKPYFSLVDGSGAAVNSIWTNGGLASQGMENNVFKTYVFDMTKLVGFEGSYTTEIQVGIGLNNIGTVVYTDYIAFYTEDELYVPVIFDKNTTDNVNAMPSEDKVLKGGNYTPSTTAVPERDGYYFAGWSTSKDGGAVTTFDNVTSALTLYAVWNKEERITVTFDANNPQNRVTNMPKYRKEKFDIKNGITLPSTSPVSDGFVFGGWSTTPDGKNVVENGYKPQSDITLYAVWSESESGGLEWSFENGLSGWYSVAATAEISNGAAVVTSTGNDPQFIIKNVKIPASITTELHVVCKFTLPEDVTSSVLSLFSVVDSLGMAESRRLTTTCQTDSDFKDYVIDLSTVDFWKNGSFCTELRLDPSENNGTVVEIKEIYFETYPDVVYFNAGGAEGSMAAQKIVSGYTLPECTFTKDGYTFEGWTDGQNTYNEGDALNLTGKVTMRPVWKSTGGLDAGFKVYYPGYAKKALVLSYDDGNETADTILIEKLNAAGMKGAFNIIGSRLVEDETVKNRLRDLYSGHEIGNHTYSHPDMRETPANGAAVLTEQQCIDDISRAKALLEEYFDTQVKGLAYSITNPNRPLVNEYVKSTHIYARNAPTRGGGTEFAIPQSFSPSWSFTAIDYNAGTDYCPEYIDRYLQLETPELTQLSIWGHPSVVNQDNRWYVIDNMIYDYVNCGQNIWNPTVADYVDYINATRALVVTADFVANPTNIDIYATSEGVQIVIPANTLYNGEGFAELGTYSSTESLCQASFEVDLTDYAGKANVILAAYSGQNKLAGVKVLSAEGAKVTVFDETVSVSETAENVSVIVLSDDGKFKVIGECLKLMKR